MKKVLFTLLMFAGMFSAQAATYVKAEPCTVSVCLNFSGELGFKDRACRGISFECLHFDLSFEFSRFSRALPGSTIIEFTNISSSKLGLAFFTDQTGDMGFQQDFVMPEKVAVLLGYKSLVIRKGQYKTTKRADGSYYVVVDVVTK